MSSGNDVQTPTAEIARTWIELGTWRTRRLLHRLSFWPPAEIAGSELDIVQIVARMGERRHRPTLPSRATFVAMVDEATLVQSAEHLLVCRRWRC